MCDSAGKIPCEAPLRQPGIKSGMSKTLKAVRDERESSGALCWPGQIAVVDLFGCNLGFTLLFTG
jgi:hypothetical protein